MPLRRDTITAPSRIMLPAYITLGFAVSLVYLFDPGGHLKNAPALRFQAEVLPWEAWGVSMFGMSVAMVVAWANFHARMPFAFVLAMYAVTWFVWGVSWGVAFFTDGATPLGALLAAFVSTAAVASIVSLVKGDR